MSFWARDRLPHRTMCSPSCAFRRFDLGNGVAADDSRRGPLSPGSLTQGVGEDELRQRVQAVGDDLRIRRCRWPEVHEQLIGPSSQEDRVDALEELELIALSEYRFASLDGKKSKVPSASTA